ncbi:MAG TPA: zinc-ribbon domain-containing protein, partial [Giesbergeria sp.]|nr:zinc-ribbon domain-containing protein [Giesbergeria sp.]
MSQTTRCPSCGTLFKVVADQLRISDGWVRCGSCQQVFDASAHLQATAPAPLLPDMALDRLRPPPAPVRRAEPVERLWGAPEP